MSTPIIKIVHTGTRHAAEPVGSLKMTGPNTYVLRPMNEHDDFGIPVYAGDTIEVTRPGIE